MFFIRVIVTSDYIQYEDNLLRGLWRSLVSLAQLIYHKSNLPLRPAYVIDTDQH